MPRPAMRRRRQNDYKQTRRANAIERVKIPDAAPTRAHLERRLSNKALGKRPHDSDDSDNLVTSSASSGSKRRLEIYASGGVAKGDKPNVTPTKAQRSRHLREDTEEILSQKSRDSSRASSRVNSDAEGKVVSDKKKTKAPAKQVTTTKSNKKPQTELKDATPVIVPAEKKAEESVLGVFKPRKRQASILQLVDQDESSLVHSGDEEQFLPDEVSTPVQSKVGDNPVGSASASRTYSSLKRKRDSTLVQAIRAPSPASKIGLASPEDLNVPEPSRTQRRKLGVSTQNKGQDEDIMAPPMSSDEETSDQEETRPKPSSSVSKRKEPVPTTEQLQNLMPSKRQKTVRQQRSRSVYDMPQESQQNSHSEGADEDEDEDEDENNHSMFQSSKPRTKQKAIVKGRPKAASKSIKKTDKSTHTSHTPSPLRLRTPLPLSTSKRTPLRASVTAKSPMKQATTTSRTPLADKNGNNTTLNSALRRNPARKQYGGVRTLGSASGKENQEQVAVEESSDGGLIETAEVKAWKKKWANIDDFEMVFEDVSMSTRSDSPTAR